MGLRAGYVGMTEGLVCWRCGASLEALPVPFGRRDECPACRADIHVCRMCRHYDTRVARACREPVADAVTDKDRSNFCNWFQARAGAYAAPEGREGDAARARLEDLFGLGSPPGASSETTTPPSEADAARQALERLFGGGPRSDSD